jgi:hypothetical protein
METSSLSSYVREPLRIACCGLGINSVAGIIDTTNHGIIFDAILFADPGSEKAGTYIYKDYFNAWLLRNGQPGIRTLRTVDRYGNILTIEQDMLKRRTIPPIAFGFKTCSQKFKVQPQEKFLNNWIRTRLAWRIDKPVEKYIFFDYGEQRRVQSDPTGKYVNVFPLVEAKVDRASCEKIIRDAGLCLPPKSSCFHCPNMRRSEILALSPDEQARAIQMEQNAIEAGMLVELKGLGRSYAWKDLIAADRQQLNLFEDLELFQTPCECTF